jgi:hypothetical protein
MKKITVAIVCMGIAWGLVVVIGGILLSSCGSDKSVVGTSNALPPQYGGAVDMITWDNHLRDALCSKGYCNLRINNRPLDEAVPAGVQTRVFGTVVDGEFQLASIGKGGNYVCDPLTDIICWWERYDTGYGVILLVKRCTYGDCPTPPVKGDD